MAMNEQIISALIGLVGAVQNNGKTDSTDAVIRRALLSEADIGCVDEIHREKFRISPDCATCQSPCGNTSDNPPEAFRGWTGEERTKKEQIWEEILRIVKNTSPESALPEPVLKGIACLGYRLDAESYQELMEEFAMV